MSEIIAKINELNAIKKQRNLSEKEVAELQDFRKLYLENFKANFKQILDNTRVINENGDDITPIKKGNN
ncbi:MAG: DUF896 domain-containing protein [Gemella sp.]|nr:DUF896 domain-containing protein [Gemella sp.]